MSDGTVEIYIHQDVPLLRREGMLKPLSGGLERGPVARSLLRVLVLQRPHELQRADFLKARSISANAFSRALGDLRSRIGRNHLVELEDRSIALASTVATDHDSVKAALAIEDQHAVLELTQFGRCLRDDEEVRLFKQIPSPFLHDEESLFNKIVRHEQRIRASVGMSLVEARTAMQDDAPEDAAVIARLLRSHPYAPRAGVAELLTLLHSRGQTVEPSARHFAQRLRLPTEHTLSKESKAPPARSLTPPSRYVAAARRGDSAKRQSVERRNLLDKGLAILEDYTDPLVLRGDAGTGKSSLALHLATRIGGSEAPHLVRYGPSTNAEPSVYDVDLTKMLLSAGYEAHSWSSATLELACREFLELPGHAPVILDGLPADVLSRLLPTRCGSPVIIATRSPVGLARELLVPPFEPYEAVEAASRLLPTTSRTELEPLCSLLGQLPAAIDIAARVIQRGQVSLAGLIDKLTTNPHETLGDAELIVNSGRTDRLSLVQLYRELLCEVRRDPYVAETLLGLVWFTSGPVPFHAAYALTEPARASGSWLTFRAAIERLVSLGVVTESQQFLTLNDLSRALLRSLTVAELGTLASAYLQRLRALNVPLELEQPGSTKYLPEEIQHLNKDQRRGLFQRGLLALENRWFEDHLRPFLSTGQVGLLPLNSRCWLTWEENFALFGAKSDTRFQVVDVLPSKETLVWSSDATTRRRWSKEQTTTFFCLVGLFGSVADFMYREGLAAQEERLHRPWLEQRDEGIQLGHDVLAEVLPQTTNHALVLSACGRWVGTDRGGASEDCPECRSVFRDPTMRTEFKRWAKSMLQILRLSETERPETIAALETIVERVRTAEGVN